MCNRHRRLMSVLATVPRAAHLHFDHAGGLLASWEQGQPLRLVFPNASYVVGREHWQRALQPHPRDRASFVEGLPKLLQATADWNWWTARIPKRSGNRCVSTTAMATHRG